MLSNRALATSPAQSRHAQTQSSVVRYFRGTSANLVPRPPTVKRWKGSHIPNKQVGSKVRDYMSPCAVVNTSPKEGLFNFTLKGGLPFSDVNRTHPASGNILSVCYTRKIAEKTFSHATIKLINDFYSDLHVERMTLQKRVKFTIDRMKTILVYVATQLLLCIPNIPVHAGYFLTKR